MLLVIRSGAALGTCSPQCWHAQNEACQCSCGGAFHGLGRRPEGREVAVFVGRARKAGRRAGVTVQPSLFPTPDELAFIRELEEALGLLEEEEEGATDEAHV